MNKDTNLSTREGCNRPLNDIGDSTSKHLETLGHVEGYHCSVILPGVVDSFVDLKGVVGWKLLDSYIDLRVGEDFLRDLVCYRW